MHCSNLMWLETEAQARTADRRAMAKRANRRLRLSIFRFPAAPAARAVVGRRAAMTLSERQSERRPLAEQSAA